MSKDADYAAGWAESTHLFFHRYLKIYNTNKSNRFSETFLKELEDKAKEWRSRQTKDVPATVVAEPAKESTPTPQKSFGDIAKSADDDIEMRPATPEKSTTAKKLPTPTKPPRRAEPIDEPGMPMVVDMSGEKAKKGEGKKVEGTKGKKVEGTKGGKKVEETRETGQVEKTSGKSRRDEERLKDKGKEREVETSTRRGGKTQPNAEDATPRASRKADPDAKVRWGESSDLLQQSVALT